MAFALLFGTLVFVTIVAQERAPGNRKGSRVNQTLVGVFLCRHSLQPMMLIDARCGRRIGEGSGTSATAHLAVHAQPE